MVKMKSILDQEKSINSALVSHIEKFAETPSQAELNYILSAKINARKTQVEAPKADPKEPLVPSYLLAMQMVPMEGKEKDLEFFSTSFVNSLVRKRVPPSPMLKEQEKENEEDLANMSLLTDESCPDIESDSETMMSSHQAIPRMMQIRNPSRCREHSNSSRSKSPLNIRMQPKPLKGTFNYVQSIKGSKGSKKQSKDKENMRLTSHGGITPTRVSRQELKSTHSFTDLESKSFDNILNNHPNLTSRNFGKKLRDLSDPRSKTQNWKGDIHHT